MKSLLNLSVLSLTIVLVSCGTGSSSSKKYLNANDTTPSSYNIVKDTITPKISVEEIRIGVDTLTILSIDTFIDYPLGAYNTIGELNRNIPGEKKITPLEDDVWLDSVFIKGNTFVFVKLNDESSMDDRVKIVFARILNNGVSLMNGIRVGMSQEEFLNKFNISSEKIANTNTIVLERIVMGVWQYYYFDQNKRLDSIIMKTDYVFSD